MTLREKFAARRAIHLSKGLCVSCENPAEEGKLRCSYHLAYCRRVTAARRRAARASKKCISCITGSRFRSYKVCERCYRSNLARWRQRYERNKREGICTQCRDEYARPGKVHCQECSEIMLIKKMHRQSASVVPSLAIPVVAVEPG